MRSRPGCAHHVRQRWTGRSPSQARCRARVTAVRNRRGHRWPVDFPHVDSDPSLTPPRVSSLGHRCLRRPPVDPARGYGKRAGERIAGWKMGKARSRVVAIRTDTVGRCRPRRLRHATRASQAGGGSVKTPCASRHSFGSGQSNCRACERPRSALRVEHHRRPSPVIATHVSASNDSPISVSLRCRY